VAVRKARSVEVVVLRWTSCLLIQDVVHECCFSWLQSMILSAVTKWKSASKIADGVRWVITRTSSCENMGGRRSVFDDFDYAGPKAGFHEARRAVIP